MTKYILVMNSNSEDSLVTAVSALCVGVDELVHTILRYASSDNCVEFVDGNLDWEDEEHDIRTLVGKMSDDEGSEVPTETVFDVGANEDDDYPGLEVYIKLIEE